MGTTSRLIAATILAAAALAVPDAAPAAPGALAVTGRAVRIMPLGDSITYGVGSSTSSSYRTALWSRLVNHAGIAVDFVGSQKSGSLPDTDHEGHSGWRIDQLTAQIDGWLATSRPDVILLHIGTNDMNQNVDIANAPNRLGTLLDRIYADLPSVTVLVAAVVPAGDATVNARVNAFNAKLPAVVQKRADAGRAARFVNLNATIGSADMNDGLHPNDAGYTKMASLWHSALEGVLANGRDWPLFRSGLEPGEFLPSWTNSVETSTNVGGYCCGLTGMESKAQTATRRGGATALVYSGNDTSATQSYAYNRVFDVHLRIGASTVLSYWVLPEQANGRFVAVDLAFTDGSTLRNSGLVDQYGVRAHPQYQGGRLVAGQWNHVRVNLAALAGKTVDRILLGYDRPAGTGVFRGFVDDIGVLDSPRIAADAATGVNLALNRPATGSPGCTSTETAAMADDGVATEKSKWCTGVPAAQWQVDLGAAASVRTVIVRHASAGGESLAFNTRAYRVLTSTDGIAWQPFAAVTGNADGVTASTAGPTSARFVRIAVDSPVQSGTAVTRIYEIEVTG